MPDIMMNNYQELARETAVFPKAIGIEYTILGLCGEAGELANKYKKVLRGDKQFDRQEMLDELGDVLWYVAMIADEMQLNLGHVAMMNLQKLADRAARNQIKGSGDSR